MIKNFQPFGKNVRKPQGDFLTHTVLRVARRANEWFTYLPRIVDKQIWSTDGTTKFGVQARPP